MILSCLIVAASAFSQIKHKGEKFSDISIIDNKITFIKEIRNEGSTKAGNYAVLTDIVKSGYAKQPFISSIRYNKKDAEITIKSKVDLLLPEDSNGIRKTVTMKYTLIMFAVGDRCVAITTDLEYLYPKGSPEHKVTQKAIPAEEFITDKALDVADEYRELKTNTKKSTLYFINQLDTEFESFFRR